MSILLFVYGTLKNNFSRSLANFKQHYLGTAKTKPEYAMFTLGGYPALLNKKLADQNNTFADRSIYGEVWEIDDECVVKCDKIEGVEYDLFERSRIEIEQFTLLHLPLEKSVWQDIESNKSWAYLYKRPIKGAANCGSFWPRHG